MKTLVIGTGGREHALARALAADPGVDEVHAAPGNPGMAAVATLHDVDPMDGEAVAALAERLGADLVVVGPEAPLVAGVGDAVTARGIPVFGPTGAAAQLEGSKAFAKDVMAAAGVPTGARVRVYRRPTRSAEALDEFGPPYVVKDDGLAAGKGVVVTTTAPRRVAHALACERVVIEEFLDGPEVSLFAITRRHHGLPPAAGPGLQADLRRRRGSQHRRHGRLHAAAVGAGRPGRRGAGDRAPADRRRDGAARHALRRPAVRRPGPHVTRRAGDRVQRPLRRPRDPAAAGAARLAALAAPARRRDRHARPGALSRVARRGRRGRGDGQRRLPGVVLEGRRDHRHRRGRGDRRRPRHPRRHRDGRATTWSPPVVACSR